MHDRINHGKVNNKHNNHDDKVLPIVLEPSTWMRTLSVSREGRLIIFEAFMCMSSLVPGAHNRRYQPNNLCSR